jgi:hypothetical protein
LLNPLKCLLKKCKKPEYFFYLTLHKQNFQDNPALKILLHGINILFILEKCHSSDSRLYNEQGFPEPTRDRIRKYIGSRASSRQAAHVSVQLNSPPIRDLVESGSKEPTEGKRIIKDEDDNPEDDVASAVSEQDLGHEDSPVDSDTQLGINIDDLLSSDDDSAGDRLDHDDAGSGQLTVTNPPLVNDMFDHNYTDAYDEDNDIGEPVEPHIIWANACQYSCQVYSTTTLKC